MPLANRQYFGSPLVKLLKVYFANLPLIYVTKSFISFYRVTPNPWTCGALVAFWPKWFPIDRFSLEEIILTRCLFHQHFTSTFYAQRSQKHKKSSVSFCAIGICACKSCSSNVCEIDYRSRRFKKFLELLRPRKRPSSGTQRLGRFWLAYPKDQRSLGTIFTRG